MPDVLKTPLADETAITELSILPDGRIAVFGASWEVLDLLESLTLGDSRLETRMRYLRDEQRCSTLEPSNSVATSVPIVGESRHE